MNQNNLPKKANALQPATRFQISKGAAIRHEITNEVKIRNLDDVEPIKQALRYCFVLIGLRPEQIPDEVQKAVLLDFIKSNLANFTPGEIKIAFELAVKGEFEVDLNHFGQFSPVYLTTVFNKYIEHRKKVAAEVAREEEKKRLQEEEERRANDPEHKKQVEAEFIEAIIRPAFDQYKETKRFSLGSVPVKYVFDFLKSKGVLELDDKTKKKIREEATRRTASEVNHAKNKFSLDKKDLELRSILRDEMKAPEAEKEIFINQCFIVTIERFFDSVKTWENVSL